MGNIISRIFYIRNFFVVFFLSLITAVFLFSCTGIFTTSLGEWAARDKSNLIPNVTVSNIDDLVRLAEKDPDMSLELLKKISSAMDGELSGEDKAKLQSAALAAAVNATGMTTALLRAADGIFKLGDDNLDDPISIVIKIMDNALSEMKNLDEAAELLAGILPDPADDEAWDSFVNEAVLSDMAMASLMLVSAEVENDKSIADVVTGSASLAQELADSAYDASMASENREDQLSDIILNVMDKVNLISAYASYTVEYYYDGEKDEEYPSDPIRILKGKTVNESDIIPPKDGYKLAGYDLELPVKILDDGVVISVYYVEITEFSEDSENEES